MEPALLVLTLLLGCGGNHPAEDSAAPADVPFTPTIENGGCGLAAYDWLDDSRLGEIVDVERMGEFDLTASAIDGLLAVAGVPDLGPVPFGVRQFRIRYLTQDKGALVEATAIVTLPDTEGPVPTAVWLHHIAGFDDFCAPSALGLEGYIGPAFIASLGFATVSPDYVGLNGFGAADPNLHPFMVPEVGAVASLDAVRALWRFVEGDFDGAGRTEPSKDLVIWGVSEGGFHAAWSQRYQPHYLPEANVIATVAAVAPTDLWGLAVHGATELSDTTEALAGVVLTTSLWYETGISMSDAVNAEFADLLEPAMALECGPSVFSDPEVVEDILNADFAASLRDGTLDPESPLGCPFKQAQLATSSIPLENKGPMLIVVGENDELVNGAVGRADFPNLCEAGYDANYIECADADHVVGGAASLPLQWAWVQDRMAGLPMGPCELTTPVVCSLD